MAKAEINSLKMPYIDSRVQDYFFVADGKKLAGTDSEIPVSNKYDVTAYVKIAAGSPGERYLPSLRLDWSDGKGSKDLTCEGDAAYLTEEEKEFAKDGYFVFRLGRIYESVYVNIWVDSAALIKIAADGFPEGVRVVRYVQDDFGGYQEQECKEENLVSGVFYIQAKWEDPQDAHKWCRCRVSSKGPDEGADRYSECDRTTLPGVAGEVWDIRLWDGDRDVLVELAPYVVGLGYHKGDIADLAASAGAEVSRDKKGIAVHGGESVSINMTLDAGLKLNGISLEGEEGKALENKGIAGLKDEGDGKWTITLNDMSRLYDVKKINLDIEDTLQRVSLSDPENKVSVTLSYEGKGAVYNGKPIYAKTVKVSVNGKLLNGETDYTVSYSDNINAGSASLTVTAAPDSGYRGQYVKKFTIEKADAFRVPAARINVEADVPVADLSELLVLNGTYDQDVKPTGYELTGKVNPGRIFSEEPKLEGSRLICSIRQDADRNSAPAKVGVMLYFANYKETRIELDVYLVKREKLALGGKLAADKEYDGKAYVPDVSGLQVISKEGNSIGGAEAAEILNSIKSTMSYHYVGTDGTVYDSAMPPVELGSYRVFAKVSDENLYYKSDTFDAGAFKITQREAVFVAEDVTLYIGDSLPGRYSYKAEGLLDGDAASPEPLISCGIQNTEKTGEYPIQINVSGVRIVDAAGKDVTAHYRVNGREGTLRVAEAEAGSYTVTYSLSGKGADIRRSGMPSGSLIPKPLDPTAQGYTFLGWYTDGTLSKMWDFGADTIQGDITLYAGWSKDLKPDGGMALLVQEILPQAYTGKAVKPAIAVYAADGRTLLKKNKDYSFVYKNNVEADTRKFDSKSIPSGGIGESLTDTSQGFNSGLAYAVITGKGNYKGTVYVNFHINPVDISDAGSAASGLTFKYTEAFEEKGGKTAAIVTQFKSKTAKLKLGTDYALTAAKAADGAPAALTDKGQLPLVSGTYKLKVEGKGNYTGTIEKELYVASKSQLIKNAKITCGKTVAGVTKDQLAKGIEPQDLQVSIGGEPLTKGTHYTVEYTGNHAIGTATVTVKGTGGYFGSKSMTFKILGVAFKEKEFGTVSVRNMTYTGAALTQNDVLLTKNGATLVYGEDYTIRYKNNIKKGKATMVFTANPSSGYSGSFNKTFTISPMGLDSEGIWIRGAGKEEGSSRWKLAESVPYQKGGAEPSDKLKMQLRTNGALLTAGKDYTVKYKDNAAVSEDKAYMTLTGKGNFTGSMTVYYDIRTASLADLYKEGRVSVTPKAARVTFSYTADEELRDEYHEFEPTITIKDGKKALKKGEDFEVEYTGNIRYQLEGGNSKPKATISGIKNYGGDGVEEAFTIPVSIYRQPLSGSRAYIVYDEDADYTYTGGQITPGVTVYYGEASDISRAKRDKVTDDDMLTDYGLVSLQEYVEGKGGDYTVSYGANTAKGKNGKVIISGVYDYGGSVTSTFTIEAKDIYKKKNPVP